MLSIYNTLARRKQPLQSVEPGHVRMYVCGITVYDFCHLGHARMLVGFDVVARWLRECGLRVTYVRNITDIDDKIIRKAVATNQTISRVTSFYIDAMHEDEALLGVLPPDAEPRATEHVPSMLDIIGRLEERGLAYRADDGDVNYAVRKFPGYGKLSGKSLDELRAGERVEVAAGKRDPFDFVLWKAAKQDEPPESRWESTYGPGRPGWHIECSAMSRDLLGLPLDIHGGGPDLKFPHHENEIAQSEGAFGGELANIWMHCGPLLVDSEKMSKSLGNFFTIRDACARYRPEAVRFFIVRNHYRSAQNYAADNLADAEAALSRLYGALRDVPPDDQGVDWNEPHAVAFREAMNDDFNTPEAVAQLFSLAGEAHRGKSPRVSGQLRALGAVLGILQQNPEQFLQDTRGLEQVDTDWVVERIEARAAAKAARDYAAADTIRAELLEAGIALEDRPGGQTEWRRSND